MRRHALSAAGALVTIAALAALVATSFAFANSHGAETVAADATVQLRAEETLSAATVARSLLSEAAVLAVASHDGGDSEAALQAVIDQVDTTLDETSRRADALTAVMGANTADLEKAATEFVSASRDLIEAIARERAASPIDVHFLSVSEGFDELTAVLTQERDERERHIAAVRAGVGDVARAARFLVAFVMPAVAVMGVLALAHHRQRRVSREEEDRRRIQLRQARDEFLSAVAHELRTPLTAVMGSARMLQNRTEPLDTTTREEMTDILAAQAVEVTDLVENLLIFARTNIGGLGMKTEVVDARAVVEKITEAWSREDLDRLSVVGEAEVWADSLRLKQVLRNLLSNALRHGGDQIEVHFISDGPNVSIQVADNGLGIPDDLRSRMFDPYEHGENHGRAATLGLGLTVARSLTRHMGGELTYQARPAESLFGLTLPAARLPVTPVSKQRRPKDIPPNKRITPDEVKAVIKTETLDIVFQPIVELTHTHTGTSHAVVGAEALARFRVGSPEEWFHAAAREGLRQELELAAIRKAIHSFSPSETDLFVSINLSFETLMSPRLVDAISSVAPGRVVLELTEPSIINHYHEATDRIAMLRSMGYRLAVDDMGTADTDLWHLVRLRPAFVKPDISLIRDGELDVDKRAIMTGLRWLAHTLPIKLIVEGVEREEEIESLRRLRIDWAQGYLFGRPTELPPLGSAQEVSLDSSPDSSDGIFVPPIKPPDASQRVRR